MPMELLIAALALALLAALFFGVAWARKTRQVTELIARQARLESERDKFVREEVKRRSEREHERLHREVEEYRVELDRREGELDARQQRLNDLRGRLDERAASLDGRAEEMAERTGEIDGREREISAREEELSHEEERVRAKLEEVAGLSAEDARKRLLEQVEGEIQGEVSRLLHKADEQARSGAEELTREMVLESMATLRGSVVGEGTVSVVMLPSDEMKGRVIGREGRNIRALEQATGVDLLVDDTPEAILLSSWDPLRRTIATRALRQLVEDGRIHPARIEEVVEKTREEADEEARDRGEQLAFEVGATGLDERLIKLLGRLSFFLDEGQSYFDRAREVALVAGAIADEMRLDGDALRRAGLLHEIARADKTPMKGHFAAASADLATRLGEGSAVTDPIRALAQPPDAPRTPQGVILVTARRMSLSRPGARRDNLQGFVDRQSRVEEIALAREGVDKAFAVRAGRELRVHVRADAFSDDKTLALARDVAREIEQRVDYPGQIRVLVLRETRAVSYAV